MWDSKPWDLWVETQGGWLVTTNSSCRSANPKEVEEFVESDALDVGDRFDVYLSTSHNSGPMDLYVFLGPFEPRCTGRLKGNTMSSAEATVPSTAVGAAVGAAAAAATAGAEQDGDV
jgi:hypothetical protein